MTAMRYFCLLEVSLVAIQRCSTTTTRTFIYNKKTDGVRTTGQSHNSFSVFVCVLVCTEETSIPCVRFAYHADSNECHLFNRTESLDSSGENTYGRDCATNLGFTWYNNTHCLKHHTTARNYTDAEKDCKKSNAHLLTMKKMSDFGLFGDDIFVSWIDGGKNMMTWYGTQLPWTKWANDMYPRPDECPCAVSQVLSMYTALCTIERSYICQIDC